MSAATDHKPVGEYAAAKPLKPLLSPLLAEADVRFYQQKGAICVRKVFDLAFVERMRAALPPLIEEMLRKNEARGRPRPTVPAFHSVISAWRTDATFREAAFHPTMTAVVQDLMQSDRVILFSDQLLVKEPGTRDKTPWHQDLPYWPVRGEQTISAWIALDAVTKANGVLEYVAGSHRWGKFFQPIIFDGTQIKQRFETIPDIDADKSLEILHWDVEPGDVLIHQGLTIHGAGENQSTTISRRADSIRYVGEEARWEPVPDDRQTYPVTPRTGQPLDDNDAFPVVRRRV